MREIKKDSIVFKNDCIYIDDVMHVNICEFESVEKLIDEQEISNLYIIGEMGFGNSALLSLVWAFDESEAVERANVEELENVCSIEQIKIIE